MPTRRACEPASPRARSAGSGGTTSRRRGTGLGLAPCGSLRACRRYEGEGARRGRGGKGKSGSDEASAEPLGRGGEEAEGFERTHAAVHPGAAHCADADLAVADEKEGLHRDELARAVVVVEDPARLQRRMPESALRCTARTQQGRGSQKTRDAPCRGTPARPPSTCRPQSAPRGPSSERRARTWRGAGRRAPCPCLQASTARCCPGARASGGTGA